MTSATKLDMKKKHLDMNRMQGAKSMHVHCFSARNKTAQNYAGQQTLHHHTHLIGLFCDAG